ncbi:hypothetical protein HMPREF1545_03015 [Oscillibacter sp. KLE 1728]|nr:hypothetical protein HMPREF1545_03015 [Oscillibacter sp. KLE 1728]
MRIVKTTADNTRHMQKSFKGQRSLRERFLRRPFELCTSAALSFV